MQLKNPAIRSMPKGLPSSVIALVFGNLRPAGMPGVAKAFAPRLAYPG
jgi:hypothetical protein